MGITEQELDEMAKRYSFLIPSDLYMNLRSKDMLDLWVKECEWHFKNGFKACLKRLEDGNKDYKG